jgi:hypothetical protein
MKKSLLILFLLPLKIFCQDLTGVWIGTMYNDTTRKFIPFEITISEDKGKLTGYSHTTWKPDNVDDIVNIGLKEIKIKRKKDKLYIEDEKWLYNNYPTPPPKGVKVYSLLNIETGDSGLVLSGPFNTNPTKEYAPATGSIRLQKKNNFAATKIIPKLQEMDLAKTLSFLPPEEKEKKTIAVLEPAVEKPKLIPAEKEKVKVPVTPPKEVKEPEKLMAKGDPDLPKPKETDTTAAIVKKPEIKNAVPKETVNLPPAKPVVKAPPVIPPKPKEQVVVARPVVKPPVTIVKQNEVAKTQPKVVEKPPPPVIVKPKEVVSTPPPKPVSNIIPVSAADLATRKIETIRSVNVKTDSLVMTLYDNGEIDGDTVSVVLNGNTIMSRQGLTANAITKTIYLTPELGDSMQLIMYAENLGSIPPNTGLLILQDGNDRYEIRFAGDLKKNSAIILRRRR